MAIPTTTPTPAPATMVRHRLIKLGLDVHERFYMVARMMDEARPQAPQRFEPAKFLQWVAGQKELAGRVVVVYEAGPFGFDLARQLIAMGIECLVVAPQDWDERNKGVKTDRVDATALLTRLDRYLAGNAKSFSVVRIPTVQQDVARARSRERDQFRKEVNRLVSRGKSLLRHFGITGVGQWWRTDREQDVRQKIQAKYPPSSWGDVADRIWEQLEMWRPVLSVLEEKLHELTRELERSAEKRQEQRGQALAKGVGLQSSEKIEREIVDWGRFTNRRQVASYTGLVPTVRGTGGKFAGGSISKVGNPRLRAALIEMAWRMVWFQPDYEPVKKWRWALTKGGLAKRKAIVAIARHLAIDLWRLNTGRSTLEQLNLRTCQAA
jgi:transposase